VSKEIEPINHSLNGELVGQRVSDGYINATAMCKAAGKKWNDYRRLQATGEFFDELSKALSILVDPVAGIPATEQFQALIISVQGGSPALQGTWVHPQVAIHLAQWLSGAFAVQVSKWVFEWMSSGRQAQARLPYHLRRYMRNRGNVPDGHFSILVEMTQLLIAPMEEAGYTLPERMLPDISSGKIFCQWLRGQGIDPEDFPTYLHYYEDGRIIAARAYPEDLLPAFRRHLREVWIPTKAVTYFRQRDANAVQFLAAIYPKALPAA
jgi:hypothetical protein